MNNTTVRNPQIPYFGSLQGLFHPSTTIRIKGFIREHYGRCVIDFKPDMTQNTNSTVIFHISMRPNEDAIVRNTFQHGSWGREERDGHYQVRANEKFEIAITAEQSHYSISLNHRHFANYHHRIPLHMVQFIRISGEVIVEEFSIESPMSPMSQTQTISSYSTTTPSVPIMPIPMPMPIGTQTIVTNMQTIPSAPQPAYNPLYPMNLNVDLHYGMHSRNNHHGHHGPSFGPPHGHHGGPPHRRHY